MLRKLSLTLGLLLSLAPATDALAAEPILLPDFTPGAPDQFAVAVMLQNQVSDRLIQDGHIVLSNDVVAPVVGAQAVTNCAAQPACPSAVLPQLPARIAVVVRVSRQGPTLVGHFELFEQSNPNPAIVRDVAIAPGNEHLFAHEVAAATSGLIAQVGPSPDAVLMAAARLIAGQSPSAAPPPSPVPAPVPAPMPAPAVMPVPAPVSVPPPVAKAPAPQATRPPPQVMDLDGPAPGTSSGASARGRVDPNATTGELLDGTGVHYRHLIGSEQHFRNSGMDPRDWVFKTMPHAGRFAFEIRAGLGMGDVDRHADMRVELVGGQQRDQWFQEGPIEGRRPRGAIYLGYAPATMIDIGVVVGLQYGRRRFTTGYARTNATSTTEESTPLQVVDAVQAYIQPRLRGYLVPTGPAKPFLFAGADVRIFDAYDLQQPENFAYPNPPGGTVPGFVGGGGMMIDPSPIVGFFFEGNYTQHFGLRALNYQSGVWTYNLPQAPVGSSFTVGLIGGVQFRI